MRWTVMVGAGVLILAACQAQPSAESQPVRGPDGAQSGQRQEGQHGRVHGAGDRETSAGQPLGGSDDWRMTRSAEDGQIEAYTTRTSAPPGATLRLKVSTSERAFRLHAYRIGAYDGGTGHLVFQSRVVPGEKQADPVFQPYETRTVVAPWHESLAVDTTGWVPGLYVLRLRTTSGWEYQVPYIVSSPAAVNTVAVVVPVTTWQAYNVWGHYSLYEGPNGDRRSWAVSFDRPYSGVGGMNDFRSAVVPIVVQAERAGVPLSYFANVDLHGDHDLLAGASGYVSTGHDEYWTTSMRTTVTTARDAGTNLAFLGANTMYWRVRLEDRSTGSNRLMTGYRDDAAADPLRGSMPDEATARFRDAPAAQPENRVTGMLYECYPVDADYVVVAPGWWGFAGTRVRRGSVIPGLVGGESDRVYPDASVPRPLQVLSHTSFSCRGDATTSQSVYYTTPSGAGVFNAGTLRWGCALVDLCDRPLGARTRDFARRVTENLLRGFAVGPVGREHPARDNVADFALPQLNTVSAS